MSSVFDNLMQDIRLWHQDEQELPFGARSTDQNDRRRNELMELHTGVMNTDPMNACRCFMVDFVGGEGSNVTLNDAEDIPGMMDRVGGSLMTEVHKFLVESKAHVTDRGGGIAGWHLGAHCSPGEAWLLVRNGEKRFASALRHELLTIRLRPWSVQPYYQE